LSIHSVATVLKLALRPGRPAAKAAVANSLLPHAIFEVKGKPRGDIKMRSPRSRSIASMKLTVTFSEGRPYFDCQN